MPDSTRRNYIDKDFSKSTAIRQSGFIAQEVEKTAKETGYNFNGVHAPESESDNYSLSYAQFVVPLVKGMQEQQKTIEQLQLQIEELKKLIVQPANPTAPAEPTKSIIVELSNESSSLDQNIPNPFTDQTIIAYNISQHSTSAKIVVATLTGQIIKTIPVSHKGKGQIIISGKGLSSGTYVCTLLVDGKVEGSKRMIKQ